MPKLKTRTKLVEQFFKKCKQSANRINRIEIIFMAVSLGKMEEVKEEGQLPLQCLLQLRTRKGFAVQIKSISREIRLMVNGQLKEVPVQITK